MEEGILEREDFQESYTSWLQNIRDFPSDPVFGIHEAFCKDSRKEKVDLSVGIFVEQDGFEPKILRSVFLSEEFILQMQRTKMYLPIDGDSHYLALTKRFIFGDLVDKYHVYGAQSVGGTSALHVLGTFLKNEISQKIILSDPTWGNHRQIFSFLNFHIKNYPYWKEGKLFFDKMCDFLFQEEAGSIVLLQPAGHNPSGADLSAEQWEELACLFLKRKLIPLFDNAYQGFHDDIVQDSFPMRLFIEKGIDCFVAHSFSKSFALYGERVGALFVATKEPFLEDRLRRNICSLIRPNYSNPPIHGACIVKHILRTPDLFHLWQEEFAHLRKRLQELRNIFVQELEREGVCRDFHYIRKGHGLFTLLSLTKEQVMQLQNQFGIYMTFDSRINIAALNQNNMAYVTKTLSCIL